MKNYTKKADKIENIKGKELHSFLGHSSINKDDKVISDFGEEWTKFGKFDDEEIFGIGDTYFDLLKETDLDLANSTALDIGCGTGRWAYYLSKKVKFVEATDPSSAVYSALQLLHDKPNVRITQSDLESIPFEKESFDLVYSLGVLHHIPDTPVAMKEAVTFVRKGGYFLVYLYYALDNRGLLFKSIFHLSNLVRRVISRLPSSLKKGICDIIAYTIYVPLVGLSRVTKKLLPKSSLWKKIPLSSYAGEHVSINILRNDALDRFGTTLEQRFTKIEITDMMTESGLSDIQFYSGNCYWIAIGKK